MMLLYMLIKKKYHLGLAKIQLGTTNIILSLILDTIKEQSNLMSKTKIKFQNIIEEDLKYYIKEVKKTPSFLVYHLYGAQITT